MPTYTYVGESPREYPFPPIMRILTRGGLVDFESEQDVPTDRRFKPVAPGPEGGAAQSPARPATTPAAKPKKATTAAKAPDPVKE